MLVKGNDLLTIENDEMLTTEFPGGKFENSCHFVEYHGNRDELFETSSETTCEIIPFYTILMYCTYCVLLNLNSELTT